MVASATETAPVPLNNDIKFVNDRIWCEWVWVVDLDEEVLEVYNLNSTTTIYLGRFDDVGGGAVEFVQSFSFSELPKTEAEFVEKCKEEEEEFSEEETSEVLQH